MAKRKESPAKERGKSAAKKTKKAPPAAAGSSSRARDTSTVEGRVAFIAGQMSAGDWLGGYTMRLALADEWGCSESSVRGYAAEAHRLIKIDPSEVEHLRATLAATCRRILEDALTNTNETTGMRDHKAAIAAAEAVAKFNGIDFDNSPAGSSDPGVKIVLAGSDEDEPDPSDDEEGP